MVLTLTNLLTNFIYPPNTAKSMVLKRLLRKLADFQKKYPLLTILFVLMITTFFLYYAARIETDSNFDVMYRSDSESMILTRLLDNEFGGTDTMFVLAKIDPEINDKLRTQDIRHPDVIRAMKALQQSLETETFVASTISLADLLEYAYGKLPTTLEESKEMITNLPKPIKESYLNRFLSKDLTYQNLMISASIESTPGTMKKIENNIKEKIEQTPFPIGVKAELTGMPVLYNVILTYLIDDNIKTIFLAILGVFLVLWFYFRSWKIALLSSIPTIFTLIWLSGTMYLLSIRITVITASIGAMMIGMSVDYAIHLTHRYHENVKEGHKEASKDTVTSVGSALFASVITTMAGFLAMTLGISPNSVTQGTVLAIGIVYAFIISIVLLPPLMILQRKYLYSRLDEAIFTIVGKKDLSTKKSIIDRFLYFIARIQAKRPVFVLIAVIIITVLILPGFGLVYMDTDGENWIPDGDDVFEGYMNIANNFGGVESMNLIFMLDQKEYDPNAVHDLRDPRFLLPLSQLDNLVEDLQWVNSVDSPSIWIKQNNNGRVPQNIDDIKEIIEYDPNARGRFNKDYSIALFTPRADSIDREEYYALMEELDGVTFPEEITITPQGSVPEDIEFEQLMANDTIKTASIGFLLIVVLASLFYASIIAGLTAFFPIVFAILWTVGVMGYIDLPFTVLTTGMLAILMGMGIDFSIHLIHGIKEKIKKYDDLTKAIPEAVVSTGQAISTTTITTVIGFMALSFATLVNTMRLGWTLALGILCTFFASILIVPAAMAIQYKLKKKKH